MGEPIGPIDSKELKRLAANGTLTEISEVRKDERGEWLPASRIQGLFARPPMKDGPPNRVGPPEPSADGLEATNRVPPELPPTQEASPPYAASLKPYVTVSNTDLAIAIGTDDYKASVAKRWPRITYVADFLEGYATVVGAFTGLGFWMFSTGTGIVFVSSLIGPTRASPIIVLVVFVLTSVIAYFVGRLTYMLIAVQADLLRCLVLIESHLRPSSVG